MAIVLHGYAKDEGGNLVLVGTMPIPHSKEKPNRKERHAKRHLIRRGAIVFKKELSLTDPKSFPTV
jgi:hypothetical protein